MEIRIRDNANIKEIALVENGIMKEYYEERENNNRCEGNIYIGIVKDVLKGMQAAFVDIGTEKNSFIHLKDVLPKIDESKEEQNLNIKIEEVIKEGQKLLIQLKKDSTDNKGARISTHINLTSKYIVLMPNTNIITVSKKIENIKERQRLIELVKKNITPGNGAVVRTSAEGKEKELVKDIKYIENRWQSIIDTFVDPIDSNPVLLYSENSIVEKMLIDLNGVEQIISNNENELKKYEKYDVELKEENKENIFLVDNIQNQIDKLQKRKIWLKCGGFITIDKTEALTAIDVNTGKFTGNNSLGETVFKVNKEATIQIAKQLRLRDLGGIIIIDYIDMQRKEDKQEIEKILIEELKKDRSKTQLEGFTKLDLMELTRKHICSPVKDNMNI